jgi:hypothetical protein
MVYPSSLWNLKGHYPVHNNPLLKPHKMQLNPNFTKIDFNITFSFWSRSPMVHFTLNFVIKIVYIYIYIYIYIYVLSHHACYITCPLMSLILGIMTMTIHNKSRSTYDEGLQCAIFSDLSFLSPLVKILLSALLSSCLNAFRRFTCKARNIRAH